MVFTSTEPLNTEFVKSFKSMEDSDLKPEMVPSTFLESKTKLISAEVIFTLDCAAKLKVVKNRIKNKIRCPIFIIIFGSYVNLSIFFIGYWLYF